MIRHDNGVALCFQCANGVAENVSNIGRNAVTDFVEQQYVGSLPQYFCNSK